MSQGYPSPAMSPPPPGNRDARRTKWAIATLIFGICGLIIPFLGGGFALLLGFIALIRIFVSDGAKRGTGMAIMGMAIASLGLVGWTFLFTNDGFLEDIKQGFDDAIEEVAAEAAASNIYEVGDCLDMAIEESDTVVLSAADAVSCEVAHSAEYIGFAELPYGPDAEYPVGTTLFDEAVEICVDKFTAYLGYSPFEQATFDIFVRYPHARTWGRLDDREISCFIVKPDGSSFVGSLKSGSAEGNSLRFNGAAIIEEGSVTAGNSSRYGIELSTGDQIVIRAVSFDLTMDPYLTLLDSSGSVLSENDDESDGNPNSILTFAAPASGTYTIDVSDAEFTDGNFVLSISAAPPA